MKLSWIVLLALLVAAPLPPSAAQEKNVMKHPVFRYDIDPGKASEYEQAVSRVMAMDEAETLRLIPAKTTVLFCGCPNCSGGQQENNPFEWTIEKPFEIECRFCDQVYPGDRYAPNRTAEGRNALGEPVSYRYYLDEQTGRDYWLEACADHYRRDWFVRQCLALARAYRATGKAQYARRSLLILHRFAESYPRMAVLKQWPYQRREIAAPQPPYPYEGGKWGRWMPEEVPAMLPEAYDLIYDSGEIEKLSQERGIDVRSQIEKDFFRATIDYVLTFGKEPEGEHFNNMAPYYINGMVRIGRIVGEPGYVHWGYRWLSQMLEEKFFYDGMWCEAPSYHYQVVWAVRPVIEALKGYSDPPGYRHPLDGLHLADVDMERQLPHLAKALVAPDRIAYPDGRICPAHDSWAASTYSPARPETASSLLPGFGHASLGCGKGSGQLQAQLHFSGGYGHAHADSLNFSLFAHGGEMLSDIGYTHTKLRGWSLATLAHNTVVIDRGNQNVSDSDGDLLLYVPDLRGIAAVEASGQRAYPGKVEVYRRQILLVRVSETQAYVLDLFRIRGGAKHDWTAHGSAEADMTAACSLPLTGKEGGMLEAGEEWIEPVGESSAIFPYGLVRQVRQGKAEKPFTVDFRYASGEPKRGVRIHLNGQKGMEAFLGQSPRIRQAEGDDAKVYDYWMPHLIVRRQGEAPLASLFGVVHEPYAGKPFLDSVRWLAFTEKSAVVQVKHGEYTDTLISTLDQPPYLKRKLPGGITMEGRLAVLREKGRKITGAWLVDGSRVAKGRFTLSLPQPRYEGTLLSAVRKAAGASENAFLTAARLPRGETLAGRWMIVTHGSGHTHAYEISRIEAQGDNSLIILKEDHGLKITGYQTEECFFPRRRIEGVNRFVIQEAAYGK
ncbi:MAG: heparinase II/III family protein [Armatimonadetes bacterium]|nr:heparinase II/III family protein [Armatimonadota bacterium]